MALQASLRRQAPACQGRSRALPTRLPFKPAFSTQPCAKAGQPLARESWAGPAVRTGASATFTAAPAVTAPAHEAEPTGESFPWLSQWYPAAIVADLDPRRPHATHLLGIPMALWRDSKGAWRAVEDRCPHRLAPLSEGRLESDGTLQCAYHGWQFNGRGACTHIPQLRGDDKAQQVACASRRSCVRAFPVQEVHGLLWVLPDSSEQAWEKAASATLPSVAMRELLPGQPEAEGIKQTTQWFVRDLPVRFDTLCENVADPSHVSFAHHGVQGKRQNENGTTTRLVPGSLGLAGFQFELDAKNPRFPPGQASFQAPNFFRYGTPFRSLNVYAVPTRPGWSRLYATFTADTRAKSPVPPLVNAIFGFVESQSWLEHIAQRHAVLDGDTYMLHVQERLLLNRDNDWRTGYYMPAPADGSVVAMRRWFDEFGGAVPTCEPGTPMPPQMTKREVQDRYHTHTVNCRHCKKAMRNTEIAMAAAAVAGVVAAVWLVARALVGAPLLAPATALGAAAVVACGLLVRALAGLREQFVYVDYVHADKH
ncbi:hypothetical protein HYH03_010969 [Edaphochlamys debaryana]|uniref:Rieske domain-containing protein n=1 Tax=Edaphochlamys debaryana TaxID=47281 RepID=A0A835XVI0_9CHLO|nr:hypothetical protein HYH03_010969 [Edaphochlamys debaryana]|eukprot:KAG2490575.1 hypothetical protein HYH03_010969 [Edaphochlamys debaryana]